MAKKKTPLNRKRILNEPAFERTRENNAEFARACTANRLLRQAFVLGTANKADRYVSGRLTKTMYNILISDPINDRGERRVPQGALSLLEGFNFNRDTSLQNVLKAPYVITYDKKAMLATIGFPSLIPRAMIETPSGADLFMLTALAASLHFEQETYPVEPVYSELLQMTVQPYKKLQLQLPLIEQEPGHTVVVALGIEFMSQKRSAFQHLDNKYNALAVVKVF